jgi:hypothetical protein
MTRADTAWARLAGWWFAPAPAERLAAALLPLFAAEQVIGAPARWWRSRAISAA